MNAENEQTDGDFQWRNPKLNPAGKRSNDQSVDETAHNRDDEQAEFQTAMPGFPQLKKNTPRLAQDPLPRR